MENNVKTSEEIAGIRAASKVAADTLFMLRDHVKPGVTTAELDAIAHEYITKEGCTPTSLNYNGFPKSICTSVNHVVCHGIPGEKKLKKGDIMNIDIGVTKDGFIGDTSRMYYVGKPTKQGQVLTELTYYAMWAGIDAVAPGKDIMAIGRAIESYVKDSGLPFSIVREYCGHGVGVEYHEQLQIIHFAHDDIGVEMEPGMVFTIEPMINAGKAETKIMPDEWTVISKDRSLSAQWEHTILVTEDGGQVLTYRSEEEEWLYKKNRSVNL